MGELDAIRRLEPLTPPDLRGRVNQVRREGGQPSRRDDEQQESPPRPLVDIVELHEEGAEAGVTPTEPEFESNSPLPRHIDIGA